MLNIAFQGNATIMAYQHHKAPSKRGYIEDNSNDNFSYFSIKMYVVISHENYLREMVLIVGHKLCYGRLSPNYTFYPFLSGALQVFTYIFFCLTWRHGPKEISLPNMVKHCLMDVLPGAFCHLKVLDRGNSFHQTYSILDLQ